MDDLPRPEQPMMLPCNAVHAYGGRGPAANEHCAARNHHRPPPTSADGPDRPIARPDGSRGQHVFPAALCCPMCTRPPPRRYHPKPTPAKTSVSG